MMRTPTEEREIQIGAYTFKEDGTRNDTLQVYTSDYSYMLKLDRFCREYPEHWKLVDTLTCQGDVVGKKYECTLECVLLRGKPRTCPPRTEEQKQAARETMMKLHEAGVL